MRTNIEILESLSVNYKKLKEDKPYLLFKILKAMDVARTEQLTLNDVVKSLPTKEEINLAANECSDINEIICEDEYWVIAKNDGFKEGADFVINKLK